MRMDGCLVKSGDDVARIIMSARLGGRAGWEGGRGGLGLGRLEDLGRRGRGGDFYDGGADDDIEDVNNGFSWAGRGGRRGGVVLLSQFTSSLPHLVCVVFLCGV